MVTTRTVEKSGLRFASLYASLRDKGYDMRKFGGDQEDSFLSFIKRYNQRDNSRQDENTRDAALMSLEFFRHLLENDFSEMLVTRLQKDESKLRLLDALRSFYSGYGFREEAQCYTPYHQLGTQDYRWSKGKDSLWTRIIFKEGQIDDLRPSQVTIATLSPEFAAKLRAVR